VLGKEVLNLALETFNRFVDFARVEKRQYWLAHRLFNEDRIANDNIRFHAHATIPTLGFVPWRPNFIDTIRIEMPTSYEHAISESEWPSVQAYLFADIRPPAVKELISTSLALLDAGYTRSAIIESVTALELAVNRFASDPDIAELTPPESSRIEMTRLSANLKHLGFSSFFRYAIPIIFSRSRLNDQLIANSNKLVELRQTTVHAGQRSFPDLQVIRNLIEDTTRVCLILMGTTTRVPIAQPNSQS
jgi:hypothetical protein